MQTPLLFYQTLSAATSSSHGAGLSGDLDSCQLYTNICYLNYHVNKMPREISSLLVAHFSAQHLCARHVQFKFLH